MAILSSWLYTFSEWESTSSVLVFLVHLINWSFVLDQINFLSSYIDASSTPINRDELLGQLIKEANYFTLAAHFFWTLWAIHMATSTAIKFGYMVKEQRTDIGISLSHLGICACSINRLLSNTWSIVWCWNSSSRTIHWRYDSIRKESISIIDRWSFSFFFYCSFRWSLNTLE